MSSARNKYQLFLKSFKDGIFYRLLHCLPIENVWKIWPIKINFVQPNTEIGWKIANDQILK